MSLSWIKISVAALALVPLGTVDVVGMEGKFGKSRRGKKKARKAKVRRRMSINLIIIFLYAEGKSSCGEGTRDTL
jgi:hypothetical protein